MRTTRVDKTVGQLYRLRLMDMHYINLKQMQIEKGLAAVQLKLFFSLAQLNGLQFSVKQSV